MNNETTAQNITAKFRSAASCSGLLPPYLKALIADIITALKTGQLVKDAYFTLFEAVGALEVLRSYYMQDATSGRGLADKWDEYLDHGSKNGQWISGTGRNPRR